MGIDLIKLSRQVVRNVKDAAKPAQFLAKLGLEHPSWFKASPRSEAHPKPWPAGFDPKKSPVFAHNEVFIPAPPAQVFAALTDTSRWPSYLGDAGKIQLKSGAAPGGRLQLGTKYEWSFGEKLKNEVTLFEQDKAIGWTADGTGSLAFHRWILEPVPGGTRLITEEVTNGLGQELLGKGINPMLRAGHQLWLESLKKAVIAEGRGKPNDLH